MKPHKVTYINLKTNPMQSRTVKEAVRCTTEITLTVWADSYEEACVKANLVMGAGFNA